MTDHLNKDINTMSPRRLQVLFDLSDETIDDLVRRRRERPFESLNQLREVPGIDDALLERIEEAGSLHFGPPPTGEELTLFPTPLRVAVRGPLQSGLPGAGVPADGLHDILTGLGQLFTGLSRISFEGQQAGRENGQAHAGLPPLAEGAHRRLSDATVTLQRAEYGLMHAPPQSPYGAPGGFGYHWHFYDYTPPAFCAFVWILRGRTVGGREVGSSSLAQGATGNGVTQQPSATAIDKVVEDMHHANTILSQCEFQFSVCDVKVLDTMRLENMDGAKLGDLLFSNNGVLYAKNNPGNVKVLNSLYVAMQIHPDVTFHQDCLHIFYVHDVQKSPAEPDTNREWTSGIGGSEQQRQGTPLSPMGIVEGGGRTIAHEAGHGLGEPHIDRDGDRRPGEEPFNRRDPADRDNLLREVPQGEHLNDFQCREMKKFLSKNKLKRGCP